MEEPTVLGSRSVAPDIVEFASCMPVPGLGILPVNAFLVRSAEPMLVDTGLAALQAPFLALVEDAIDLQDLRWIWLSHMDADHLGNLVPLLARAPNAKVVTNFLGMGKMMLAGLPVDRVHMLEPGMRLSTGDREIVPLRPPYYDAPETLGFFDTRSRALFTSDAFGAVMDEPAEEAAAIPAERLREGMVFWSAVDSPWLGQTDRGCLTRALEAIDRLDPALVLSSHLPAARGMTGILTGGMAEAYSGAPVDGLDAAVLDSLLDGRRVMVA